MEESSPSRIDVAMGGFMSASSECRNNLTEFKLQYMPEVVPDTNDAVCAYFDTDVPTDATSKGDCTESGTEAYECCHVARHPDHMSSTLISNGGSPAAFECSLHVDAEGNPHPWGVFQSSLQHR